MPKKKIDVILARGAEGAGDIIFQLNLAHAWSALHDTVVELVIHWSAEKDYHIHPIDPETAWQRYQLMHEKYFENHRVYLRSEWGSDEFALVEQLKDNQALRKKLRPPRVKFPNCTRKMPMGFNWIMPFAEMGCASWRFEEKARAHGKIVVWSPRDNIDPVKDYKREKDIKQVNWDQTLFEKVPASFPEHDIVELTYRDSFIKAYQEIKQADFCVGYDGMWHMVARNFGVPFITATGGTDLADTTTPDAMIFKRISDLNKFIVNELSHGCYLVELQKTVMKKHSSRLNTFRCGI